MPLSLWWPDSRLHDKPTDYLCPDEPYVITGSLCKENKVRKYIGLFLSIHINDRSSCYLSWQIQLSRR